MLGLFLPFLLCLLAVIAALALSQYVLHQLSFSAYSILSSGYETWSPSCLSLMDGLTTSELLSCLSWAHTTSINLMDLAMTQRCMAAMAHSSAGETHRRQTGGVPSTQSTSHIEVAPPKGAKPPANQSRMKLRLNDWVGKVPPSS